MEEHYVESKTNKGVFYKITIINEPQVTCTCLGFKHRKTCKHVKEFLK